MGATAVFGELQTALNYMWDVEAKPDRSVIMSLVVDRLRSFSIAICVGFLLLVSLVISAVISGLQDYMNQWLPGFPSLWQAANVIACVVTRSPQIGGKEGWYWFVLAPVLVPALLAPAIERSRWLIWWIAAWDIVITDCQLIPTWLGLTSPAHPSLLFRWGPMHLPPAWTLPFRAVQLAALFVMVRRA